MNNDRKLTLIDFFSIKKKLMDSAVSPVIINGVPCFINFTGIKHWHKNKLNVMSKTCSQNLKGGVIILSVLQL